MGSDDGAQTNFRTFYGLGLDERIMIWYQDDLVHVAVKGPSTHDRAPERMMTLSNEDRLEIARAILGEGRTIDVVIEGELAEAQRDTARLKWANENMFVAVAACPCKGCNGAPWHVSLDEERGGIGDTLREAIDAAREAHDD